MNDDAFPEFATTARPRPVIVRVRKRKKTVLPPKHHPECVECCAMGRCHWCLNRPESGTLTSTAADGYVYSACRTHVQYFAEMQRRATPNAGLDLRAGLEHLEIALPSPLTR